MRVHRRHIAVITVLFLSVSFLAGGCSEEEKDCPVCPDPGTPSPSLDNLWPNEDGNSWTYEWVTRNWNNDPWIVYEDPGSVPGAPSLDYVEGLLDGHPMGIDADTTIGMFRLEFDGMCEGAAGATGQCLVETAFDERSEDIMVIPPGAVFNSRLITARPELAGLVGNVMEPALKVPLDITVPFLGRFPLILHGGVWEKTADYIGNYGNVDILLAWKFLESDISVGHEFTFQLLPSLASDIFLHCRVLSYGTVVTEYGSYDKAVECLYLIDYGVGSIVTLEGTRYYRLYEYGTTTYAPTVGPVHSYERIQIDASDPDGPGIGDNELFLIGSGSD